ncbi:hypothetical protein XELAEV_18021014mg [Xenopus laevis]|uniref:DAGKc domain-containing protein n=1 Tax=Xenopus laevis TaxID=8355 RepID=A0A974HRJ3_XENLA|nr:hypothetical protein XELAEV_18021014mg [Xenopus laevis]
MESAHSPLPSVLCSVLSVKRQNCEVTLDPGLSLLSWRELRPRRGKDRSRPGICLTRVFHQARGLVNGFTHQFPSGGVTIPVTEIVSVGEEEIDEKYYNSMKWQHMCKPHAFTVRYVQRARKHRWRCKEVTFWCNDEQLFYQWLQALNDLLEQQTHRPKYLLVYINPYGGKKRGKQIYETKVAPLFSAAGICADVIVTEYANHARDNLYEVNLEKYDGVVCVGGDGIFSEVLHGLIGRVQKGSDVDHNNPNAHLSQCNIRIGIIPAGSTDCICYATVGINDPETSALHIILGDCQPLDVCSVHNKRTFLKYSVSLLGYGFYGDVLKGTEKNRWCYICRQSSKQLEEQQKTQAFGSEHRGKQDDDWTTIKGRFMAINAVSMSCACPRTPKGLSPAAHLADGSADLILVRKCSRLDFLRHLIRHTSNKDQFDFPFVEVYRVKNFQFTPKHFEDEDTESTDIGIIGKKNFSQICTDHPSCGCNHVNSIWNCDGETLDQTAIEMRVHYQLIKLFARGIENAKLEDDVNQSKVL